MSVYDALVATAPVGSLWYHKKFKSMMLVVAHLPPVGSVPEPSIKFYVNSPSRNGHLETYSVRLDEIRRWDTFMEPISEQ